MTKSPASNALAATLLASQSDRADDSDVLTIEDVEAEFKLKSGTQASMRSRGQLPYFRLGGGRIIRYRRRELVATLEAGYVPAGRRAIGGAR